jgi:hypothetical protein
MNHSRYLLFTLVVIPLTLSAETPLEQQEAAVPTNPLKNAYFGETHVHTSYSLDAYIGGARLTPDDAYRFAKGETMVVNGQKHNIVKPLDFCAVTDHAEYIGEMYSTQVADAPGHDNEQLVELRGLSKFEKQEAWFVKYVVTPNRGKGAAHPSFYAGPETTKSAWQLMIKATTDHYEPGRFTTLAGYEWTSAPGGGNMHRNILFRDLNVPAQPFSAIESTDEEKLWDWMEQQEKEGRQLLAIPHNSNASKGFMFEPVDNSGNPIDKEYAERRSHFEPLIEMMQIKGNSEVHRKFWPADEFADFENGDSIQNSSGREFKKDFFVRAAIINGLEHEQKLGANPYKLGFVGGTDTHNGTPSDVVEDNYQGSHGGADGPVERRLTKDITGWIDGKDSSPGAITGVWAEKNTRAAIWDGMKNRECFATSGTRIKPRFFGGADLPANPADAVALVKAGYDNGHSMGSTLSKLDKAPTFYVHASKDSDGANLDRIQIIKGWVTKEGEAMERIYDVAVSDGRTIGDDGRCKTPVGNTVDLKTAYYKNTIGATELMGSWTDPDFDPELHALYYTRTLEIPTPRWSTYDAVQFGVAPPKDVPATIQERAWSSPIWYTPN